MKRYAIEPHNEPDGEGNGWCVCASADATSWAVFYGEPDADELVDAFPTEAEAFAYVERMGSNAVVVERVRP